MSFRNVKNSIGNAFKTGWQNGNIQKGMSYTGLAAFGVGMTGSMIHDIKHSKSIFGGYMPMCGYNSFGCGNIFGGNSLMYGNMFNTNYMGGMNCYPQVDNTSAFMWGQQLVEEAKAKSRDTKTSI